MAADSANYPARACAARDYVIGRGVCILFISLHFFGTNLLSSKIEIYFNTDRLLSEFNGLWYSLAARQVFVAIANPDSLSFG